MFLLFTERSRRGQYGSRQKLPSKKNQQKESELESSFICQDVVLGEFSCAKCKYTTFKKWQMLTHIKKKHPTQSTGYSIRKLMIKISKNFIY